MRSNRERAFDILKRSINSNKITLFFNKREDISLECIIEGDNFKVMADSRLKELMDRVDYDVVYGSLRRNLITSYKELVSNVSRGISKNKKLTLSQVARGVLGPLHREERETRQYNVYEEMYIKKEHLIREDSRYEVLLDGEDDFIKVNDYIDIALSLAGVKNDDRRSSIKEHGENYGEENKSKKIVDHIHKFTNSRGFIYDDEDIANLYLSIKTKPFVILAGISGTGKSKIIELFAEAVGANKENGRYHMISVKPDWNDGTDLFGYIDISGDFIPGELTKIVYEANKEENLDKPYFICLDEMNLARVEYYLSEYLSLIETRKMRENTIVTDSIFPKNYFAKENIYKDIYFSDNINIVGTVNMDDTTFSFSEKVLDRANTIEYSKVNLDELIFYFKEVESLSLSNENFETKYLTIKDAVLSNRPYVERINKHIIEINDILEKYNRHFGYRIRDEIVFYMLENHNCELLEDNIAFDFQIMQKILPRISGSDYETKKLLIDLFNYLNPDNQIVEQVDYLDKINTEKSEYLRSSKKIEKMLRSYENGYVSFW